MYRLRDLVHEFFMREIALWTETGVDGISFMDERPTLLPAGVLTHDIEDIGRRFRGQITFWGEIDRQWVLPFGTLDDVRAAVQRVRAALDGVADGYIRGGVIAECEWGNDVPRANVEAVLKTWQKDTVL